jgi:hypothetical protein
MSQAGITTTSAEPLISRGRVQNMSACHACSKQHLLRKANSSTGRRAALVLAKPEAVPLPGVIPHPAALQGHGHIKGHPAFTLNMRHSQHVE